MTYRSLVITSVAALLLTGCSDRSKPKGPRGAIKAGARDVVVARFDGKTMTAGEVADTLAKQPPYVRARFTTPERKKAFLQKLLRFEVLVAEARRRKLDRDPEVQRRKKRAMVDILMKQLNKELVTFKDVTDAEVAARYERDKAKYQRPERVRAALILLATEAEAKKALAKVAEKAGSARHFAELAHKISIDAESKKKHGDIGFFARDDEELPKALREAVFALPRQGRVAGPLKLEGKKLKGWAIVLRSGRLPPMNRPLAVVKDRIKNELFHEKRFAAVTGYADTLKKKAKIEIDEAALAKVTAPARSLKKIPFPVAPPQRPVPPPTPAPQTPPGKKP